MGCLINSHVTAHNAGVASDFAVFKHSGLPSSYSFQPLPFTRWVHSTLPLLFSCQNLVADYLHPLETQVRQLVCFSECQSQSSVSTLCWSRRR